MPDLDEVREELKLRASHIRSCIEEIETELGEIEQRIDDIEDIEIDEE